MAAEHGRYRGGAGGAALALLLAVAGCNQAPSEPGVPGYVEGDWVYVAAPVAGALQTLGVAKGDPVAAGALLFQLDPEPEARNCREAEGRRLAAAARLENLRKGLRPSEVEALQARLAALRAAAALSEIEKARAERLVRQGVATQSDLDHARSLHDQNLAQIAGLQAELVTAGLGGRSDEIRAAEAELAAAGEQLRQAEWRRDQKRQAAPAAGRVQDTLFRVGEWVPAGTPVVMLLPPGNVKIRFFVPEPQAAALKPGQTVRVRADGLTERTAQIRYISSQVEYTPPVLFSRDQRAKLVYLVEAVFSPEPAVTADGTGAGTAPWNPGLPVDVRF